MKQKDKDEIRSIIRDELTIKEVSVERMNKEGVIERKTVDICLPDWIAAELPNLAGALRGVQETADHAKNNSIKALMGFGKLAETMEGAINNMTNEVKRLNSPDAEYIKIESDS